MKKYPKSAEIFKFLEECHENNIGDKPRERPVDILFNNYGMPLGLALEYEKEFYNRRRKAVL